MKRQFIPTSVHFAVDRVIGPALVLAPTLLRLGRTSPEGIVARAVGSTESAYSKVTDYELNGKKFMPMRVHLALDMAGGVALAVVPQLTGARKRGKKHWLPHLAIGALEVGLAVLTQTEAPRTPESRTEKLVKTAKRAKETAVRGVAKVR